jgi:hypothetical protein
MYSISVEPQTSHQAGDVPQADVLFKRWQIRAPRPASQLEPGEQITRRNNAATKNAGYEWRTSDRALNDLEIRRGAIRLEVECLNPRVRQ